MENVQRNLQMNLEETIGRRLSALDASFLDDVARYMRELKLELQSPLMGQILANIRDARFPVYLLFIELNARLFNRIIEMSKLEGEQWALDIALMQLYTLDPLNFSNRHKVVCEEGIREFCSELLNAPKNIFWTWSDKYDFVAKEIFDVISSHSEGLTMDDIVQEFTDKPETETRIREALSNSVLTKCFFIIRQNGKYYPFFSHEVNEKSLSEAREHLQKKGVITSELLRIEYAMPKYHIL